MNNPYKHILIGKQIKIIDFERCKKVDKPKNVTQFCQFIISKKVGLRVNRDKFIKILKDYKNDQTDKDFDKIINYLRL
jgi:predicted Ser/Thr protein kinase